MLQPATVPRLPRSWRFCAGPLEPQSEHLLGLEGATEETVPDQIRRNAGRGPRVEDSKRAPAGLSVQWMLGVASDERRRPSMIVNALYENLPVR